MTEILMILVIVLVVLGPEKIPDVAKFAGKAMREIRKASNLLRDAVIIDDFTATPKKASVESTGFDSVDGTLDYEDLNDPYFSPEPSKNEIRVADMSGRRIQHDIEDIELTFASTEVWNREVYLHVPYEETS